jgi:DNA repair protein RadD
MLQMATGAGKTAIFSTILRGCYEKQKRALMVVRGRSLVDQASKRLEAMEVPHGVFMAGHKRFDLQQSIQIVSIDTARSRAEFPLADYVIVDEAHYAVSDSFKTFLENYGNSRWLSVTATPWSKDGLEHLATKVVYPISIRDLTTRGHLAKARYFVPSDFDASKVEVCGGEFKDASSILQMDEQKITGDIVENYLKNCVGQKTFLFAVNVAHAKIFKDLFEGFGVVSVVITADTPIETRLDLISSCDLIISVATLTTGVDVPELRNIILARPTSSKNLYIQMLGRGTRVADGKDFFTIYDHVGNIKRHGFIEDEEKADLKPQKRVKSKNGEVPIKLCGACLSANPTSSSKCSNCGEEFPKKEQELAVAGRGELKEVRPLTLEEKELKNFRVQCSKLLGKAWAKGYQSGWMYHEILKKFDERTFRKHVNEYNYFVNTYKRWDAEGKNDLGQKKGVRVQTPYNAWSFFND